MIPNQTQLNTTKSSRTIPERSLAMEYPAPPTPKLTNRVFERVPLDKFRDYIYCICVVNFDLDIGQGTYVIILLIRVLEMTYPPTALSAETIKKMYTLAFLL
jgi:hypothetical protein